MICSGTLTEFEMGLAAALFPPQPHLRENIVMVTWANNHYYDFVQNWVYNIKKLKVCPRDMPC